MTAVEAPEQPTLAESIVEALGAAVAAYRDTTALSADGTEITYGELWERTGAIAQLLGSGPQPDPPHVVVLLEPGIDAVVALLGVVRAGLAYIALDPVEPADRLRFICEDAQAGVLLTDKRHSALADQIAGAMRMVDVGAAATRPTLAPGRLMNQTSPGLIVYTSGSTGQPKGVIRNERNEVRYAASWAERLGVRPSDRVTMLFSLMFGASNTDIYGCLLHGATLCLYDTRRLGVAGLPDWIAENQITVLHAVPTVFRYLADHAPEGGYPSVRAIELAGEPVFRSDVRRCRAVFRKDALLVNRYAATEITVLAQYVCGPADEEGDAALPAGVPPDWVEILIRDESGSDVPAGIVGEIVIRSAYLSPGYWRRPDLTEHAFTDDPGRPGMRLYHTGDAGSLDADGVLTVAGRLDSRVKVRGQSIEPAEVEAALRGLRGVREAIIDVERDGSGADADVRLVGYVVPAGRGVDADAVDPRSLRLALAEHLPPHMLPARLRIVDSFPVTRTGKVDRKALRSLPADESAAQPGEPPEGELEKRVAAIFESVLGVPVTSRTDDFFMLGGTSMTLAQLQLEVRREMGAELHLGEVITSGRVMDVAASIASGAGHRSELLVPLRQAGTAAPLFLVHGWHGQAFVTRSFLDAVPAEHPIYSIQARGLVDGARPHRSLRAMASGYLDAIAELGHSERPVLVGICAGGVIAVEMARQGRARGLGDLPVIMLDPPFPPYRRRLLTRLRDIGGFYLALSVPRVGASKLIAWRIARRFRIRSERLAGLGDEVAEIDNDAAMRVALSVGIALRSHRPRPYDGPVQMIASERRLSRGISAAWRRELTGKLDVVDVGETHKDALDPTNESFRAAMRSGLAVIAESRSERSS